MVTREELLGEVWGHRWTGASSNVVEAVISGLRRKMGDRAAALEIVRGVGRGAVRGRASSATRLCSPRVREDQPSGPSR